MGKLSVKKWMENLDCTYDEVLLDNNQICQLNKKNFNDARTNLNKIWENNRNINLQKYFNNAKDLIGKVKGRVNEFGKTITCLLYTSYKDNDFLIEAFVFGKKIFSTNKDVEEVVEDIKDETIKVSEAVTKPIDCLLYTSRCV